MRVDVMEELDEELGNFVIRRQLPWEALPDFFIGAHAAIEDLTLLTREARRFRTYSPKLGVLAP